MVKAASVYYNLVSASALADYTSFLVFLISYSKAAYSPSASPSFFLSSSMEASMEALKSSNLETTLSKES